MPEYTCECCHFKTNIKPHFARHIATAKHLALVNSVAEVNHTEVIEDLYNNIAELKAQFAAELADLKNENKILKASLDECRAFIFNNHVQPPPPSPPSSPQPQQIIITQQAPVADETCNPRYIEKNLNKEFPDCEDIHTYFSYKSDNIKIQFDDIEEPESHITKKYVVDRIVALVKENCNNMPFKYIKSSWYVKTQDGWQREEPISNKGIQPNSDAYVHSMIVKKLLYIFKINVIKYFDEVTNDTKWRGIGSNFDELSSETLDVSRYTNGDLLNRLKELY